MRAARRASAMRFVGISKTRSPQRHRRPPGPALGTLAWLVALLAVFVPFAERAFRRA